ncbi:hypothetical protein EBU99_14580, partial [bacterium]|nr:hypothetical protein [bacterium]
RLTELFGASIPYLDTEHLPIHFMECIKTAWSRKLPIASVFVDFAKAYDKVHPEIISTILTRLGVPPKLVLLLHHWNTNRNVILRMNGTQSDPIHTKAGVGQGDVLSCILFCIFMSSLDAYLKANCGDGALAKAFVDDVHSFSPADSGKIQAIVTAICEWATAFGMQLQVGPSKTALMLHPVPGPASPVPNQIQSIPITTPSGNVIPWVNKYKYLGLPATEGLADNEVLSRILTTAKDKLRHLLAYNSTVRRLPVSTQVQLLKTCILDSYLQSTLVPTQANLARLNPFFHTAMRTVLANMPTGTPSVVLSVMSGLPTSLFTILRSRFKVYLQTKFPVFPSPLPQLFSEQEQRAFPGSWMSTTLALLRKYELALGCIDDPKTLLDFDTNSPGKVPTPSDLTRLAAVYARGWCLMDLLDSPALKKCLQNVKTLSSRPGVKPTQHFYDLMFGFTYSLGSIMFPSKSTPLSTLGPLTSANLITRVTSTQVTAECLKFITFSMLGAQALVQSGCPFAPASWKPTSSGHSPSEFREAAHGRSCPLCDHPTADPWHIINECTHPTMVHRRQALHSSASVYLPTLSTQIFFTQPEGTRIQILSSPSMAHYVFNSIQSPVDWATPTGKSTLYRLLLVLPWPAAAVDDPSAIHALALGHQFDTAVAPNHRLHRLANSWTLWATKLRAITFTWKRLVDIP